MHFTIFQKTEGKPKCPSVRRDGTISAKTISCIISLPGICSAAVTSSTWAATLATVETTIATATSELEGLDALANGLTGKMMDHYCA